MERMQEVGVNLPGLGLKAETGKIQFDKYRRYVQATNANDACRLIWAENIPRYVHRASRNRVGKEWLAKRVTLVVPPNITGTGIVTQRTTANEQPRRIIATLITPQSAESGYVYSENGTNFIAFQDGDLRPSVVLGELNSCVVEHIFRRLNSNVHVSAGELNTVPFPPMSDGATLDAIEALVLEVLELGGVGLPP